MNSTYLNDRVHLPGRLQERDISENRDAGPASATHCSALSPVLYYQYRFVTLASNTTGSPCTSGAMP